jgi:hypothetical protein
MKQIIKKISMEDMKSRLPGIIPSLNKKWVINYGNYYSEYESYSEAYRDAINASIDVSKIEEKVEFTDIYTDNIANAKINGNYGMIPSDIEIPYEYIDYITDYTDIYINIPDDNGGYYTINQISKKDLLNRAEEGSIYYFYYGRDIYSINCTSKTKYLEIADVLERAKKHKFLTYRTLQKWYSFFNEYHNLLNSGKGKTKYKNALEYYEYEIEDKSNNELKKYEEYDSLYNSRGGDYFYNWINMTCLPKYRLPKKFIEKNGFSYLYYGTAIKFYYWLKERYEKYNKFLDNANKYTFSINVSEKTNDIKGLGIDNALFTSELVDKQYSDYNLYTIEENTNDLDFNSFMLDGDNIVSWPEIIVTPKAYTDSDLKTICMSSDDCCDCFKYFKRGGNELYYDLKDWIDSLSTKPISLKSASLVIPITLSVNIDDIGEMAIFSNEYKEKTNYKPTISTDENGGTVVNRPIITNNETGDIFVDNNVYMIKNESVGYVQNDYKENVFNEEDWIDYTGYYVNKHKNEFVTDILEFAYNDNGKIVYNPSDENMSIDYDINYYDNGFFLINDKIYPVELKKYVYYKGFKNSLSNGLMLSVDETADGQYYTKINNRIFYAIKKGNNYYFNFKTYKACIDTSDYDCEVLPEKDDKIGCIKFANTLYVADKNVLTIDINGTDATFTKIDGYVDTKEGRFYIKDNKIFEIESELSKVDWKKYDVKDGKLKIVHPYTIYKCDEISGHTNSKLDLFRQTNVLHDDLGNEMPGYYEPSYDERTKTKYAQPYNDCLLDLYYKVGNVSQLSKNNNLTIDGDSEKQFFNGNIMESMEIYHTINGKKLEKSSIILNNSMNDYDKKNVLTTIELSMDIVNTFLNSDNEKELEKYIDDISNLNEAVIETHCVFTYYIGAILRERITLKEYNEYSGYELAAGKNHGVKYVEDDVLKLENCLYNLLDGSSFTLRYYNIIQNTRRITLNDYNNQLKDVNDAIFYSNIKLLGLDNNGNVVVTKEEFTHENGFDQLDNTIAAPVFRKEYDFGVALPQNIKSDIYIDRGINKALDKHLRLQEISDMNSLLQYGNGSVFNIIEN